MSLFLLAVAFVFSGLTGTSNKAFRAMGLDHYLNLYVLTYYVSGIVLSMIMRGVTRHGMERKDIVMGLVMGLSGSMMLLMLMLALRTVDGVVAFSVRGCANSVLTAALSFAIWREDVSRLQWLGIACAVVAIYLLL